MSDQSNNIGHGFRVGNQIRAMAITLGIMTVLSVIAGVTMGSVAWLLLAGCAAGWGVLGIYFLMNRTVIEPVGDAIGRILVPAGGSTPSVAQHSNIEAMEMRGRYADAVQAYQDVIRDHPADVVACEKLGQLAMRQLKDFPLAITAYREAEKRVIEPGRKVGFAMIVAGIYRENLKDYGKAMVELRRVASKYPEATNRARLSAEIDELKAKHFEGP
jgi:tetratricopeptide (TPR) repeat protein